MAKEMFQTIHGNIFETPQWLFDSLDQEFDFQFDLAACPDNAKCKSFFTEADNSLTKDWHKIEGWLWLNPPYSPIRPWIEKAQLENSKGAKIVILCPPIISTKYFHRHLPAEIRFILGRVPFGLNGIPMKSNTNDSCLLIYDTKVRQPKIVSILRDSMRESVKCQL